MFGSRWPYTLAKEPSNGGKAQINFVIFLKICISHRRFDSIEAGPWCCTVRLSPLLDGHSFCSPSSYPTKGIKHFKPPFWKIVPLFGSSRWEEQRHLHVANQLKKRKQPSMAVFVPEKEKIVVAPTEWEVGGRSEWGWLKVGWGW